MARERGPRPSTPWLLLTRSEGQGYRGQGLLGIINWLLWLCSSHAGGPALGSPSWPVTVHIPGLGPEAASSKVLQSTLHQPFWDLRADLSLSVFVCSVNCLVNCLDPKQLLMLQGQYNAMCWCL